MQPAPKASRGNKRKTLSKEPESKKQRSTSTESFAAGTAARSGDSGVDSPLSLASHTELDQAENPYINEQELPDISSILAEDSVMQADPESNQTYLNDLENILGPKVGDEMRDIMRDNVIEDTWGLMATDGSRVVEIPLAQDEGQDGETRMTFWLSELWTAWLSWSWLPMWTKLCDLGTLVFFFAFFCLLIVLDVMIKIDLSTKSIFLSSVLLTIPTKLYLTN